MTIVLYSYLKYNSNNIQGQTDKKNTSIKRYTKYFTTSRFKNIEQILETWTQHTTHPLHFLKPYCKVSLSKHSPHNSNTIYSNNLDNTLDNVIPLYMFTSEASPCLSLSKGTQQTNTGYCYIEHARPGETGAVSYYTTPYCRPTLLVKSHDVSNSPYNRSL